VHGPITRSRAQQLNLQVNSFLCLSANNLENRLILNNLIVIMNQEVGHGGHVGHQEGAGGPRKHKHQGGDSFQIGITEFDFESNSDYRTTLPLN
jgi:hypothetical protein